MGVLIPTILKMLFRKNNVRLKMPKIKYMPKMKYKIG